MRATTRTKAGAIVGLSVGLALMVLPLMASAQSWLTAFSPGCAVEQKDVNEDNAVRVNIAIPNITQDLMTKDGTSTGHYVKNMSCYIAGLYVYFMGVVGILATVMGMYGGVKYVISFGNPQKLSEAKDTITGSLMGLLIAVGSYGILYFINPNLTVLHISGVTDIDRTDPTCGINGREAADGTCNLVCPEGYAITDCYMCLDALKKHEVLWSNDMCATEDDLNIGKLMKVEPNMADALQQAIGDTMYSTIVAGETILLGGPKSGAIKVILKKFAGSVLKIGAINDITNIREALTKNPSYQGKIVYTDPKAACCVKTSTAEGDIAPTCSFVNGFAKLWEGQCSGILFCKDHTACGQVGPNKCWGIYADKKVCFISWGQDDTAPYWSGRTWGVEPGTDTLPANMTLYQELGAAFGGLTKLDFSQLITGKLNTTKYCGDLDMSLKDPMPIKGLGVLCPNKTPSGQEEEQQCVVTHIAKNETALELLKANGYVFAMDPENPARRYLDGSFGGGLGWGNYVSDYALFKTGDAAADRAYWMAKGGHCLPVEP